MIAANGKIIVRVNLKQKDFMEINGVQFKMALSFEKNYRERSPVLAEVVEGNEHVRSGNLICCHHNMFYPPSPYHLYDDLFSIPANKTIFGIIRDDEFVPVYGNMICETIEIETPLPLPPEQRKNYINRYKVKDAGWTNYKPGQVVFTRPHSGYEIVFIRQNIETRLIKVDSDMICGFVK